MVAVLQAATRSASVREGLQVLDPQADVIVIHDAVHPLATKSLFAVQTGAATVPVVALAEALKRVEGDRCVATVPRGARAGTDASGLPASALHKAHANGEEASEDSELIEVMGLALTAVPGDPATFTSAPWMISRLPPCWSARRSAVLPPRGRGNGLEAGDRGSR